MKNHPFHLVSKSPWPVLSSVSTMILVTGLTSWLHKMNMLIMNMGLLSTSLIMFQWWRDISRESTLQGNHTNKVIKGMKMGMILFITSEVMFFLSFFWAFFHSSLSPSISIGMLWPPKTIKPFNPTEIPLLNTIILLTSGASITWAHHSLLTNKMNQTMKATIITIFLGIYFSLLQLIEYKQSMFTIADSTYGSTFFITTGFHGMHVLIGTTFILINSVWIKKMHINNINHLSFETAAWYWHFVDVIWLLLYTSIYWWGK